MASTTRIPKAEITGLFGYVVKRFSRKLLGDVPEPAAVRLLGALAIAHRYRTLTYLRGIQFR